MALLIFFSFFASIIIGLVLAVGLEVFSYSSFAQSKYFDIIHSIGSKIAIFLTTICALSGLWIVYKFGVFVVKFAIG